MARRLLVAAVLLLLGLAWLLRPAVVSTDTGSRLLVLLRWQSGRIQFVNSVTGRPVSIGFRVGTLFDHFAMSTDPGTEEYYTDGLYAMNDVVTKQSTDTLRFCSINGIHLALGFHDLEVRDGCLEVKLLWTTCSGGSCM
jgi:hypothetical protein